MPAKRGKKEERKNGNGTGASSRTIVVLRVGLRISYHPYSFNTTLNLLSCHSIWVNIPSRVGPHGSPKPAGKTLKKKIIVIQCWDSRHRSYIRYRCRVQIQIYRVAETFYCIAPVDCSPCYPQFYFPPNSLLLRIRNVRRHSACDCVAPWSKNLLDLLSWRS